ncbi:hypothetical protein JOB18_034618 [Solea senegalensis]|uniref:Uncharacterized protein n=1 Tax=Solea senegalensis TaxID=28829 RepID=A0AAV6S667_SOLSE|nr:hypothetical protein JOB18_034618 [Solea senegalensis]
MNIGSLNFHPRGTGSDVRQGNEARHSPTPTVISHRNISWHSSHKSAHECGFCLLFERDEVLNVRLHLLKMTPR